MRLGHVQKQKFCRLCCPERPLARYRQSAVLRFGFCSGHCGVHEGKAFYLLYNGILGDRRPQGGNVLTGPLLATLAEPPAGLRVIYGESCRLSPARLKALGIVFKQIPYDIRAR